MELKMLLKWIPFLIIMLLLTLVAKADNPPYPCGTRQDNAYLCPANGELYPDRQTMCRSEVYAYPKRPTDTWVLLVEHSWGGRDYILVCHDPVETPLDSEVYIIVFGAFGTWYLWRFGMPTIKSL